MSTSGQRKSSIKDLVHILDNPRSKTLPRRREVQLDREQIRRQMKNKWRDPGFCHIQFSKVPCVRAKLLNQWDLERISLAERSYMTPKNSQPYRFDQQSRQFQKVPLTLYTSKFQRYLKSVESEKQDLLFKEKRTVTEGITPNTSTFKENKEKNIVFRPTHTASKAFGFTTSTKFSSVKLRTKHFKTLNL